MDPSASNASAHTATSNSSSVTSVNPSNSMFLTIDDTPGGDLFEDSSCLESIVTTCKNGKFEIDCSVSSIPISDAEGIKEFNMLMTTRPPKKQAWTKSEDKLLIKQVGRYGPANWDILATHIKNRTGKQCRERYLNILDPNLRRNNWTEEEDLLILSKYAILGNQWSKISRSLVGRSDNSVKNRYNAITKNKTNFATPTEISSFVCAPARPPQTGYDIFARKPLAGMSSITSTAPQDSVPLCSTPAMLGGAQYFVERGPI